MVGFEISPPPPPNSKTMTPRYCVSNSIFSVTAYSTTLGQLTLHHNFPKSCEIRVVVDVRLLLEKLNAEQTSVGQWVNVIGYVSAAPSTPPVKQSNKRKMGPSTVHVQALMLWPSGPLDIGRYETYLVDVAHSNGPTAGREKSDAT